MMVASSTHYLWQPAGSRVTIHLSFDVVDRLLVDVTRAFSAVPRRGAEVGGLLLGTIDRSTGTTEVTIEDFEPVPIVYEKGPSYLLNEEEEARLGEAASQWSSLSGQTVRVVGYFRSHTREGLGLSGEDLALIDRHIPGDAPVALVIKPFATRIPTAGFFLREDGQFQSESPLEFPFRRKELGGGQAGRVDRPWRTNPGAEQEAPASAVIATPPAWAPPTAAVAVERPAPLTALEAPNRRRPQGPWLWVPLSLLFLLVGVFIGIQVAVTFYGAPVKPAESGLQAIALGLAADPSGRNLHVRWNRESRPILEASRGALIIHDGTFSKTVELDAGQLQNGSVIYRPLSEQIRFRLEVYPRDSLTISEVIEARVAQPAPEAGR
ncbi:MAG: hypothetical protein SFV54_26140 [Bryobacteraceae bacterium]|nr:hypothetical protein [Bryobacteraceae bacterium]